MASLDFLYILNTMANCLQIEDYNLNKDNLAIYKRLEDKLDKIIEQNNKIISILNKPTSL